MKKCIWLTFRYCSSLEITCEWTKYSWAECWPRHYIVSTWFFFQLFIPTIHKRDLSDQVKLFCWFVFGAKPPYSFVFGAKSSHSFLFGTKTSHLFLAQLNFKNKCLPHKITYILINFMNFVRHSVVFTLLCWLQ